MDARVATEAPPPEPRRPLEGLRVLDLGVIVYGAEVARLFADQGAEVIKIESRAFPDGGRVASGGTITESFAAGHRGKKSVGLNLRSADGVALFKRLVAASDVVLSNFKPGTLESLGIGPGALAEVNPGIVVVTSSAMGSTGPWSTWVGYGPLVRAASGLTGLWRYADDPDSFSDGVTIYPDHFAARVMATAGLAALIARRRTARGTTIEGAQAEAILGQLDDVLAMESSAPGSGERRALKRAAEGQSGVFPCAGDDEWAVIAVRDGEDRRRLAEVVDDPGRLAEWTAIRPPRQVQEQLQAVGVPAGMMMRFQDLCDDPHVRARGSIATNHQPDLGAIIAENGPFLAPSILPPAMRPAPRFGEHTRAVMASVLGLDDAELTRLLELGVLEE